MVRKGMGKGTGKSGYFNLVPKDPSIHSMSAKGIKQRLPSLYAKDVPKNMKKGLIKELARKVADGAKWAIQWEKEHLPEQEAWVKTEFNKAKDLAQKGIDTYKANQSKKEQAKRDAEDVRDELDTNDDGVQDIPMQDLEDVNAQIRQDVSYIDTDNNGVADYQEEPEQFDVIQREIDRRDTLTNQHQEGDFTIIPFPPSAEEKSTSGDDGFSIIPLPEVTPSRPVSPTQPPKPSLFRRGVDVVKQKIEDKIASDKEFREHLDMLSEPQLEGEAVKYKGGMLGFGGNPYEKELLRRIVVREQIHKKKKLALQRAISGESNQSSGMGDVFGFINPSATFQNKAQKTANRDEKSIFDNDALGFLKPAGFAKRKK